MSTTVANETKWLPQDKWFIPAAVGFGLCIASTEAKRYTALWSFDTKTPAIMAAIAVAMLVAFIVIILRYQKHRTDFTQSLPALITISTLQTLGVIGQLLQSLGVELSEPLVILTTTAAEASLLIFLFYAQLFLKTTIHKAAGGFIIGILVAGAIQLLAAMLWKPFVIAVVVALAPASAFLLVFASRLRLRELIWYQGLDHQERQVFYPADEAFRDAQAREEASKSVSAKPLSLLEICLSIFFLNIIFIGIHTQWTTQQDAGVTSFIIQTSAGLSLLLAGNLFLLLRRYFRADQGLIDFIRTLILPVALAGLYLSTLFNASAVLMYNMPLNFAHACLLLIIWLYPFRYSHNHAAFLGSSLLLFSYKAGWGVGVFGIMILPTISALPSDTVLIIIAFVAVVFLSVFLQLKRLRIGAGKLNDPESKQALGSQITPFDTACASISAKYHLTPREQEVFCLLARGRNAGYIARALTISDGTSRTHIMHIYQKLNITSQQSLIDEVDIEMKKDPEYQ